MASRARISQILLTVGFLAVIGGVPIAQVGFELYRGEPVQATDLFRYPPTVKNLRRYEQSLEDCWWGQERLRPRMQRLLFGLIGDTGVKAVAGRDNWMFYRPGVQYLFGKNRLEPGDPNSTWIETSAAKTQRESVVDAIVRFRDQLKDRGIELLVVPIPGKASVYPEMLARRAESKQSEFHSPTEELLKQLDASDVQTVDLFAAFRDARQATSASGSAFYLARDTHWTPAGAGVAAAAVARKLKQLDWVPEHPYKYTKQTAVVRRSGDVVEMMHIPGARESFPYEKVECTQVLDPFHGGPLVPPPGDREGAYMNKHLLDTPMESSFLLLGDSFSRIYQFAEPASLGQIVEASQEPEAKPGRGEAPPEVEAKKKRLLPGSAGFPSLLADALNAPVDYIVSDGGAATDVRQKLSVNAEILDNKKVVIWEFTERDVPLGKQGWRDVPLPPES